MQQLISALWQANKSDEQSSSWQDIGQLFLLCVFCFVLNFPVFVRVWAEQSGQK